MFKATFVPYLLYTFILLLFNSLEAYEEHIVILHINHESNPRAKNAARTALNYIYNNDSYDTKLHYQYVDVNLTNEKSIVKSICSAYDGLLNAHKPIHLILETSLDKRINFLVRKISSTINIPTVSVNVVSYYESNTFVNIQIPHTIIATQLEQFIKQQTIYKPVFILDELYSIVIGYTYRALFRTEVIHFDFDISPKVSELISEEYVHFVFFGESANAVWFLDHIVENHKSKKYLKWYIFTFEEEDLALNYKYSNVIFANPVIPSAVKKSKYLSLLKNVSEKGWKFSIIDIFYFEITLNAITVISKLNKDFPLTEHLTYLSCKGEYIENMVPKSTLLFLQYFEKYKSKELWLTGFLQFSLAMDMKFTFICKKYGTEEHVCFTEKWTMMVPALAMPPVPNEIRLPRLKISAILQEPMIYENYSAPNNLSGFYIDLIDLLAKKYNFTYDIEIGTTIGELIGRQWTGGIRDLINRRTDILLGSIPMSTQADSVVDFTIPIDNFKGFSMLAKKLRSDTNIFRYVQVLEGKVWLFFLGTYLLASILLWSFDYWSPLSNRNNRDVSNRGREFTFKESLWFCITSLTPQGGGEIPRNFSGKVSAIAWCIIGFIMLSAYTSNLAAFMTISRMYSRINTIYDLFHQHDLEYGPYINSSAHKYFQNMKHIEDLLYEKWKNMCLKDYDSTYERAQWAVWSSPITDYYSRFIEQYEFNLPPSLGEAVERIRKSKSGQVGYIYIGETYDARFLELTDCDLIIIGEEFAKRPYSIAVQQRSPLKNLLDYTIRELRESRQYNKMMEKWWKHNPKIKTCPIEVDGVKIENVAGLFILLFTGIGISCVVLTIEYYVYIYRQRCIRPQI